MRPAPVLKPKEYSYLPELIIKIFKRRADVPGPITQRLGISENDPRAIVRSIAPVQRPPMEQILESRKSRFSDIIL